MTTYTLNVNIDPTVFPVLKQSYNLCIAKKVNGTYNVVWQGGTFEEKNVFSWVESYQTFATQTYAQGLLVSASCIPENIQAGETCILDTNGDMDSATGTPVVSPSTFFVQNDFGSIHIGVNQLVAGTWAPVFVSPEIVKGPVDLTPLVSVMVWFDLTLTSGTMFFESISNSVEVDYNGSTTQTATYTVDETWTLGAAALARNSYSITDGFSYIDSRLDPFVFASSLRGIQIAPIAGLVAAQATTTSGFAAPPPEIEGILQFSTAAEANNAWAFLKQKIMHNIQQNVPAKVDDNTIKVTLKFLAITFMKFMIKGATNPDKIKNAFLAELQALATQPTSTQIRMGGLAVMNTTRTCQFVALDTTVALNRDVQHHNVYGYVLTKGETNQKWNFVDAGDGLYYIQFISHSTKKPTYLSTTEEGKVIHNATPTTWGIRYDCGGIRIIVPFTDLNVELGDGPDDNDAYKIVLAEKAPTRKQIWRIQHFLK